MSAPGLRASASSSTAPFCASRTASRGAPTRPASTAGAAISTGLITRAEHEYRSRGLRPGFRLTPLTPPAFQTLLSERGYVVDTEAVVMVADALPEVHAGPDDGVSLRPELDEEWLRVFQAVERRWPPEQDPGARWVLGSGDAPRRFALARVDGVPAATGYGRLEGDWLYIACVATFPEQRRRGLARIVSERLSPGARPAARSARSCRSRRKTRSAGALCAARIRSALHLSRPRSRALTNNPAQASQGPDGWCRCSFKTDPGRARGYA